MSEVPLYPWRSSRFTPKYCSFIGVRTETGAVFAWHLTERETFQLTTLWSESTIIGMIRWTGLAPWELEFRRRCSV